MPKHIPPGEEANYIRRTIRGKVFYVRRAKTPNWSQDQCAQRSKFARAAAYAKRVMATPEELVVYAEVAKKRKAWRVFPIIAADYLNPPIVHDIELAATGNSPPFVHIWASDDFEVVGVDVSVRDAGGQLVMQGPAEARNARWQVRLPRDLAPGQEILVEATARDRPGNAATKTVRLSAALAAELARQRQEALPGILARRAARKAKRA
jgi:hypothetical protein